MPEDQPIPPKGTTGGLLTEAKSQVKKLFVAKVLVLLGGAVTALLAFLRRGSTELEQGLVWGAVLLLLLQAIALFAYSAWTLRQSKRIPIQAQKRKANPTAAEREAHLRSLVGRAASLAVTTKRVVQHVERSMVDLENECARQGINFAELPEHVRDKLVGEFFAGPPDD